MSKTFLGKGLGFPVTVNDNSILAEAAFEESIRQSIWIILATAKGERVMRPDFGCGIYDLVFEVNSPSTVGKVSQAVREALLRFEPRIDVLDVQVTSVSDFEGEKLLINIDYQVRATNNVFNLVYPFYLERSVS
ncbi:GPW/gp25 family protein [Mastigocoleus sp. MO_188.B34]|uniref:GPW/gp25 family protein n=1 Tax=Mastigocoleus sp. MO_188.B34 TaxID=3036635 RepID=UPI0026183A45|nr:GPW/gp25 family protein [Mastigocoleus sp. MO_188.B34]MDJ0693227.1 GPW/gp25 family protein [Mastigocoleus sp. MO_188.B34]